MPVLCITVTYPKSLASAVLCEYCLEGMVTAWRQPGLLPLLHQNAKGVGLKPPGPSYSIHLEPVEIQKWDDLYVYNYVIIFPNYITYWVCVFIYFIRDAKVCGAFGSHVSVM